MEIRLKLDPKDDDLDIVRSGLIAFNDQASGLPASFYRNFALHLVDDQARAVGGMTGRAVYDWLFIELLHVPAEHRGRGFGRALMARAEDFAREHGLAGLWLDTFEFQARGFYEKLGFSVFGTLEDHPVGSRRYFMSKRLAPPAA